MRQSERGRKEGQGGRRAAAKRVTEGLSKPSESVAQWAKSCNAHREDGAKGGRPAGGQRRAPRDRAKERSRQGDRDVDTHDKVKRNREMGRKRERERERERDREKEKKRERKEH